MTPYERFESEVFGPPTEIGLSQIGDRIDRLSRPEADLARARLREALATGFDPRVLYAARYLKVAEAPALLRAHLARATAPADRLALWDGLLAWDREDDAAVAGIASVLETADPETQQAAIRSLWRARFDAPRFADAVRAALEARLLDPAPIVRWAAHRGLLDERGLRQLVLAPDPVAQALETDASAGARAWRAWRASVRVEPFTEASGVAFLREADRLPITADPSTCGELPQPCLTFEANERMVLRCSHCGRWQWQDYEYEYLVGGWSEESRPTVDLDLDGVIARVGAATGWAPAWLASRPGRAHLTFDPAVA